MTSKTKSAVMARHGENNLLNAPAPPLMQLHAKDLSMDEAPAPLDEQIIKGAGDALDSGQTHYVPVPGIDPLREAIAGYLNGISGASYESGNVVVTAGMQESRFLTLQLIDKGRRAIPETAHPGVRRALGVRPMEYETMAVDPKRMLPTLEAIQGVLESGCALLYLESPSRLTGAAYNSDEVSSIADMVKKHEAGVIWDAGLAPFSTEAPSIASVNGMADHSALIGEAFPGVGLASWFIGYIAAPTGWIPPMQKQKQVMAICTSTASQYAALEAANLFDATFSARLSKLQAVRSSLIDMAVNAGLTPLYGSTASVVAVELAADDQSAAVKKLAEAGYAVVDGKDFGAPTVIRLTVTPDGAAEDALKLLAE